jgi:hypothetical protein
VLLSIGSSAGEDAYPAVRAKTTLSAMENYGSVNPAARLFVTKKERTIIRISVMTAGHGFMPIVCDE